MICLHFGSQHLGQGLLTESACHLAIHHPYAYFIFSVEWYQFIKPRLAGEPKPGLLCLFIFKLSGGKLKIKLAYQLERNIWAVGWDVGAMHDTTRLPFRRLPHVSRSVVRSVWLLVPPPVLAHTSVLARFSITTLLHAPRCNCKAATALHYILFCILRVSVCSAMLSLARW